MSYYAGLSEIMEKAKSKQVMKKKGVKKMSEKVIAIMDRPEDCRRCVFGVCNYSTPLSTREEGYYCQLTNDRTVYSFKFDEKVHIKNCPLISLEKCNKQILKDIKNYGCSKL